MNELLSVQHLTKRYKKLTAVDDISFNVAEGQCFGLLGPNGAGKTTAIEVIEGILPATSGDVRLFGEPARRRQYQRVGIQFQHTALPDYLTVRETLQLFAAFYPRALPLDDAIELCALGDFVDRDTRRLSGGQRQRLLLALALINDPDLVFLDEPTTGLDPQSRRHFWSLVQAIKARGKTVVLTTHYMDEAQVLCDQIAIMDGGRIIERGAPADLLAQHFDGVLVHLPAASVHGVSLPFAVVEREDGIDIQTTAVDETVRQLSAAGVPLDGLKVSSPNLEDLFLKLTGHALRV
ncbi:ABC transporter ATP-binding protein [Saccharospirillum mangrovi]|uniref:ABC transporter ATP-binding protein n=1 Tax=Saccharospirillum mangrovi TaxID=2161747 RepID=UPI000D38E63B|nr:ABC transporter ATP-binding protein [Saccharospirillum mangrovi]